MTAEDFTARYGPGALILGGSEGVGAALAQKLAARGLDLHLVARKPGPLQDTAGRLAGSTGRRVRTLALDLGTAQAADAVLDWIGDAPIGLLVSNAGAESRIEEFLARPAQESQRMIALNVATPTQVVRGLAPAMARRGRGGVILVSSASAAAGAPLTAVYAAAKAYLNILAEGLWGELRPAGVDVLGLVLGLTRTPAMQRMGLPLDGAADPAAVAEEALEHLRDGPLWFASGVKPMFDALHGMERREAVRIFGEAAAALRSAPER